ncbi:hypothetical protein LVW35_25255 [Pseudomonas sp. HN11]|uniref:hypothetical protein n=1 Tax=Pseudomonas sp. HN11 TaxID=1344094 RepID=UPI001F17BAFC|nr:hypothetical protein [Pseudomonas sp. HN11]UII70911.1 hypothetical protein LVW35_25255 [Pseudomonas sp. HN11]
MRHSNSISLLLLAKKKPLVAGSPGKSTKSYHRVKMSKIGDLFSGRIRPGSADSFQCAGGSTRALPNSSGSSRGGGSVPDKSFDQKFVDSKAKGFDSQGHTTGVRSPGDDPSTSSNRSPELDQYRTEQQKKWQLEQDNKTRDKLFGQKSSGEVGGEGVKEFSSEKLSQEAASASSAKAKVDKAAPARNTSLLRTAAIAMPFSALGLVIAGTVNAFTKTLIDPAQPTGLSAKDLRDTQIVQQSQNDVFVAANALNDLNGHAHVAPDLKWAMQSNDERMDTLEEMVDIVEKQLGAKAKELGIPFTLASTGASADDVPNRALSINSRLAVITGLLRSIASELNASVP